MTLEINAVLFLTASLVVIVAPGPDNILVLTCGVTLGRRAALVSVRGMGLGAAIRTSLATFGLSALLTQSATAVSAGRYAGAAYPVYPCMKTLLSKEGFTVM
jgi:threonine/homoserine/homoserine lactone efflux protein